MTHIKNFEEYSTNGSLESTKLVDFTKTTNSSVNEDYIELAQFNEPNSELISAFKEWYNDTKAEWDSFKENMSENSVDEAAKNAQIEILTYLSNEMNKIIKDGRFKVKAVFK